MVDVASIVVAVIALVGGLAAAAITGWFTYFSDERKRLNEAEKLIAKYSDPLLLAAQDLQSRLYNITDLGITGYYVRDDEHKDNLLLYTAFLVGQCLAWTRILRLQAQFLRFATDEKTSALTKALGAISFEFSTDRHDWDGTPFNLWRGQQMAIGELMTVDGDGELLCMGYAAFFQKWRDDAAVYGNVVGTGGLTGTSLPAQLDGKNGSEDEGDSYQVGKVVEPEDGHGKGKEDWSGDFRPWFRPIIEGVTQISIAKTKRHARVPDQRLRRLQHLLLDLIRLLDEKGVRSEAQYTSPCHRAVVKPRVKSDRSGIETAGVKMSMNPFDELSIEEAVRLRERKAPVDDILAFSAGPAKCSDTLRTAMAMGADRAIHVELPEDQPLEPLGVAKLLKAIAEKEQSNLIFLGKQAIDDDSGQTGQMLAGLLNWPQACQASKVEIEGENITVTREVDGGQETLQAKLPMIVTTDLRLNEPRYASLPNIMKAKKKKLEKKTLADYGVEDAGKARLKTVKVEEPRPRKGGGKVEDVDGMIAKLKELGAI